MEQVTAHILIEGQVQGGVTAISLCRMGNIWDYWLGCNLTDGRVEVLLPGIKTEY